MKKLLLVLVASLTLSSSFSQNNKIKPDKYPSLLWEITGNGLGKPSYLFGTMHVSSKMAFNLSDSFYMGIKGAQVVALETNPATWQEDFSRYDMDGDGSRSSGRYGNTYRNFSSPRDYLTINTIKLTSYEKMMEAALYSNPSIINSFLYRSNSERSSDFEEDTYLDLHIFQAGKKLGKKICGVEDFDGSMQLVKEAYADAAKEKNKKDRSYDYDEDLSYRRLEEAYRTGNLDLLDTINKVNSQSAAFDEKFLYKRNDIQAASIDSILKTRHTLFVGVGAAHLPGDRGVIEILRRAGYKLRPIKMATRDSRHKDEIEKIRVPVQFTRQTSEDGFYTVSTPGKLYSFVRSYNGIEMQQFTDMVNGSYYMVTRILTNAAILGHNAAQVKRKIDSVLYENIPGKILSKKAIVKNGYHGFEIMNRTRRGDHQRYAIFVSPFEIIIFKMSGNGDYVKLGTEAAQFFSSIQLKEHKPEAATMGSWKKYKPSSGGFQVELPHQPLIYKGDNRHYAAYDAVTKTAYEIIRTDVHNYDFAEEDSFDLNLMEESFSSSEFIHKQLNRKPVKLNGYSALDVSYQYKDSSVALVRFLINGPRYYTLVATATKEHKAMQQFISSFSIQPFIYAEAKLETDTSLHFTVKSPVPLDKKKKMDMFPEGMGYGGYQNEDDDVLMDNGDYDAKSVDSDSTGEKIYVSFYKPSQYYYADSAAYKKADSIDISNGFVIRYKKVDTLPDKAIVVDYELGNAASSRLVKGKAVIRAGTVYRLETLIDTVAAPSAFITSFFTSFQPSDTLKGIDVRKRKTELFFSQFFSNDTLKHKTAVQNISNVAMDASDFSQLRKSIGSLGWKERKYLDVKKNFIAKLSSMPANEVSDYLKELYYAAGDTLDLQYTALETLLQQATSYSYKTFAGIMESDPPVLDLGTGSKRTAYDNRVIYTAPGYYNDESTDGSFIDNLQDTLKLTAGIYKNLLPLININDYEQTILELTGSLLDSGLISHKDYEAYLPKFIIEAKQTLKKQIIQEKAKAIAEAKEKDGEKRGMDYGREQKDYGNKKLSLYATLLLPFWDTHPQVQQIVNQLFASKDKELKYTTALLLVQNKRPLPDTMLHYFASMDEYRFALYTDLKNLKRLAEFPAAYKNQEAIARSEILSEQSYSKPDTIVFLQRVSLNYKSRDGFIYVFKYKEKKEDNNWRLTTIGLLPKDETVYAFDEKGARAKDEYEYDFSDGSGTKLTTETTEKEQIEKLLKRIVYSKRKSAARFYTEGNRYNDMDFSATR